MKLPRDISAKDFIIALERIGYQKTRQKGSHVRLTAKVDDEEHHLTIPLHNPLKVGTLNHILNELSNIQHLEKKHLVKKLFE